MNVGMRLELKFWLKFVNTQDQKFDCGKVKY